MTEHDPVHLPKLSGSFHTLKPILFIRAWKQCAGPAILKNTEFLGVYKKSGKHILNLKVPDGIWFQELQMQKSMILERFNLSLKNFGVKDVVLSDIKFYRFVGKD